MSFLKGNVGQGTGDYILAMLIIVCKGFVAFCGSK